MSNLDEIEYYKIVNKILNHPEFQKKENNMLIMEI